MLAMFELTVDQDATTTEASVPDVDLQRDHDQREPPRCRPEAQ